MFKRFTRKKALGLVAAAIVTSMVAQNVIFPNGIRNDSNSVLAAGTTESANSFDSVSAVNYSTILGRGVDFGIVAENFLQKNHMETTYAVNYFGNTGAQTDDIDFISGTAQVIIGHVITDLSDPHFDNMSGFDRSIVNTSPLNFGSTGRDDHKVDVVNFEATSGVFAGFDKTSHADDNGYFTLDNNFWRTPAGATTPDPTVVTTENDKTPDNIERIYNNAFETSDDITTKIDNGAAINYRDYAEFSGSDHVVLNLNQPQFKNRVVYIDVDETLNKYFANSNGIRIIKDSSTVVVFNISDASKANKEGDIEEIKMFTVSVDNGQTWITSETESAGNNGGKTVGVDAEICQKIIWNITTSRKVELNIVAGTFIIPYSKLVDVTGSSAGWLVTKNAQNTSGEWHYIYQGGNQNVLDDGEGEIHFAARKAFTHEYDGTNTVEDETVYSSAGEYSFYWYEDNANFNAAIPAGLTPIGNTATNKLQFPKLKFSTTSGSEGYYVAPGDTLVKYFTICEVGAGTTNANGVEISNGKINITLTVYNNNGKLEYYVKTTTYLDDGSIYKVNEDPNDPRGIRMSGIEFSLGAFFNKVESSFVIDKSVKGGDDSYKTSTYRFTVQNSAGRYYSAVDGNFHWSIHYIEVIPGTPVTVKNIPNGTYTVTEVLDDAMHDGYTLVASAPKTVTVGASVPQCVFVNEYLTDTEIKVQKTIKGFNNDTTQIPGGVNDDTQYAVNIESVDYPGKYLNIDGTISDSPVNIPVSVNNPISIKPLLGGEYKVTEVAPATIADYTVTTTYNNGDFTVDSDNKTVTSDVINTYKRTNYYAIIIDKEVDGATVNGEQFDFVISMQYYRYNQIVTGYINSNGELSDDRNNSRITVRAGEPKEIVLSANPSSLFQGGESLQAHAHDWGINFTVEEIVPNTTDNTNNYTIGNSVFTGVTYTGGTGSNHNTSNIGEAVNDNSVAAAPMQATITATNTYKPYEITIAKNSNVAGMNGKTVYFAIQRASDGHFIKPDGSDSWDSNPSNIANYLFEVEVGTPLIVSGSAITAGTYTITEVSPAIGDSVRVNGTSYVLASSSSDKSNNQVILSTGNPSDTITFTNTYDISKVDVDISKVRLAGSEYEEVAGAKLTLTGTLKSGGAATFTDNQLKGGGALVSSGDSLVFISGTTSSTISGLADGSYILTETELPTSTEGTYSQATQIEFTIDQGKIISTNVSGTDNTYKEATLGTNAYFRMVDGFTPNGSTPVPTGSLTVSKTVTTAPGSDTAPTGTEFGIRVVFTVPAGTTMAGTYTVTGGSATTISNNTVNVNLQDGQSVTFTGIPAGVTYEVTEPTVPEHYTSSIDVATGTITNGVTSSATVTNTYNYVAPTPTGSIKITKTISGTTLATAETVSFTVTGDDGSTPTVPVLTTTSVGTGADQWKDEGNGVYSYTITGLPTGVNYDVVENLKSLDNYDISVKYTVGTGSETNAPVGTDNKATVGTDVQVTSGGTTIIAVTNTYAPKSIPTGSLTVEKKVETATGSSTAPADASFTIRVEFAVPAGTTIAGSYSVNGGASVALTGTVVELSLKAGQSAVFSGIPINVTYTVTEPTVPANFTSAISNGTGTISDGGNSKATVTNTYNYVAPTPTCSIVLFKEAKLDGTNISARTFKFHVQGEDNLYYGANGTTSSSPIDISVTSNDSNGVPLAGLPVQKYTVTEVEDYMPANCGYDPNSVRSCEVNNLTAGESRDVTLKNLYKTSTLPSYGSLTIEKTQDTGSETIPADQAFTFTVVFDAPITNAVADPNYITGTVSYSTQSWSVDLKVGQKAVLNNLPVGIGYEITETAVTGYNVVPAVTGTITASGNTETIANYLQPTTTAVPTGALKITKTVVTAQGSDAAPSGATFNVKVEFTVPAGTTLTGSYAVSGGNATVLSSTDTTVNVPLTAGQYVEFTGIPATVNYTVTETNIPEHFTASYSGATGTIAEGTTAEATVTNTYDYNAPVGPSGSLTLNKVVSGCPALNNTVVNFYVHNTTTDKYYDVNHAEYDTAVAVPVTPGTVVVIDNLPDGTYEVTEDAPALPSGFVVDNDLTHTSGSDSITNGSAASVTLTNAYKVKPTPTGALVIEKSISGTDLNSLETITFTIKGDNGTVLTAPELKFDNVGTADGQWKSVGNGKYTYTFTGLVTGEKFTVTEVLDGHTSTYVLVASSSKTTAISDAIRENDTVTVQLTDAYQKVTTSPNPTPTDIKHPITFTKDDITTLENLPGTSIIIKDEDGNTVGTWTHGDTPETIELPAGTYTLVETSTPTGYKPIKPDTTITVGSNGTITSATGSARVGGTNMNLVIVDYEPVTPANVTISKQDVAGNEIPQATLTITSIDGFDLSGCVVTQNGAAVNAVLSNGNKSISFVTISTWPSIIRGLQPGTYELKETVTPEAYLTAEAIIFTVRDDGSVWVGTVEMQGSKIVMVDKADPTYNQKTNTNTNTNTAVTATGEGTSAYTVAALIMIMMASAFVATVFYRKWRYDVK